jgi:hypothetical protein
MPRWRLDQKGPSFYYFCCPLFDIQIYVWRRIGWKLEISENLKTMAVDRRMVNGWSRQDVELPLIDLTHFST